MIHFGDDASWSGPSWLFDWIVDNIADVIDDPPLAAELKEVVEHNIGFIGVNDFPPSQWARVVDVIRNRIVPIAERDLRLLPGFDREGALQQIRDLAASAPP
jgi:hypothetical protein